MNTFRLSGKFDFYLSIAHDKGLCALVKRCKPSEIENVIIPVLDMDIQKEIATKVQESFALRKQSKQLLEYAKQAVEMAIEQGEDVAMEWLKDKVN